MVVFIQHLEKYSTGAAQQISDSSHYDDVSTNNTLPQITQCSLPLKQTGETKQTPSAAERIIECGRSRTNLDESKYACHTLII